MTDDRGDNDNDQNGEDDKVGYCNPPKHSRWKKGQSGNPRGRPKSARGLKTDLKEELGSQMTIAINGKHVTATKQRLMVKALTARAAAGDTRAAEKLVDMIAKIIGVEDEDSGKERLSARDQALLEQWMGYGSGDTRNVTEGPGSDG